MKGILCRLFVGIMILGIFLLGSNQPWVREGTAQEGTFEAYGNFFGSTPYDKNNYTNSAALQEAMFVFDAIKSAILKRDLGAYKKHVTAEILQLMDAQDLMLTGESPIDIIFLRGWAGEGVVLFNVVLKYKDKADEERDPIFIKEGGGWKMNAGIGLEKQS